MNVIQIAHCIRICRQDSRFWPVHEGPKCIDFCGTIAGLRHILWLDQGDISSCSYSSGKKGVVYNNSWLF